MMRRLPLNQPNFTIRRERDTRALSRFALLLFSGLLLAGGFIFAAGQHFAAVNYGYESEKLRLERTLLKEQQQRLLLAREEATAPARLESEGRKAGLQPVAPSQIEPAQGSQKMAAPATPALAAPVTPLGR